MKYFIGKFMNFGLNQVGMWGSQINSTLRPIASGMCQSIFILFLLHVSFLYIVNIFFYQGAFIFIYV